MPPAVTAGVRKYGRAILCNLIYSLKTSRLYTFSHPNVKATLGELEKNVGSFISLAGACRISRLDDRLFFNSLQVKADAGAQQIFQYILQLFKERGIGKVVFQAGIELDEIESFVKLLSIPPPPPETAWESFEEAAAQVRMPSIVLSQNGEDDDSAHGEVDRRLLTMGIYFKTISFMDTVLEEAKAGKPMALKRLKQAVQAMVDLTWKEEHLLLSLVNVKDRGEPGSNHAVNVAVLSIALGARLGLSKKLASELGFAALLHDIGKVQLPEAMRLSSQHDVSAQDQKVYGTHVYAGVRRLLRERVTDSIMKSINVAFLHHVRYDCTGYPKLVSHKPQSLFTRIVAVADFYDNVTTPRPEMRGALEPEAVERALMDGAGTEFDPLVAKAFINLLGLYPQGCLVRLDTGEVATVVAPSSNPRFLDRPIVKVVVDAAGNNTERTINLLDRGASGRFLHTILKLYPREELHLELDEYLTVI